MNTAATQPTVRPARGGLSERFLAFIDDPAFPCVGSKAALARGARTVGLLGAGGAAASA